MRKIILVDNHESQLNLLVKLLDEKYDSFVENYNKRDEDKKLSEKDKPAVECYLYNLDGKFVLYPQGNQTELSENKFLKEIDNESYYIVDLCLTEEEEDAFNNGNITNNEYATLTGYKLVEKIAQKCAQVSIMTKFFVSVKVEKYAPILAKPLRKTSQKIEEVAHIPKAGIIYLTYLPKELETNMLDDAFCNMVYFNYFTKDKEWKQNGHTNSK